MRFRMYFLVNLVLLIASNDWYLLAGLYLENRKFKNAYLSLHLCHGASTTKISH